MVTADGREFLRGEDKAEMLWSAVTDAYRNPPPELADRDGLLPLALLAEDFCLTPQAAETLLDAPAGQTPDALTSEAALHSPGLERYRKRLKAEDRLKQALAREDVQASQAALWAALVAFAGYPFRTAKGLLFSYIVRGNEIFFTRKEKSVTRASVNKALGTALAIQQQGGAVTGPKKLNCFGASYLYPVLIRLGVIG